jgi:hypothetical protein
MGRRPTAIRMPESPAKRNSSPIKIRAAVGRWRANDFARVGVASSVWSVACMVMIFLLNRCVFWAPCRPSTFTTNEARRNRQGDRFSFRADQLTENLRQSSGCSHRRDLPAEHPWRCAVLAPVERRRAPRQEGLAHPSSPLSLDRAELAPSLPHSARSQRRLSPFHCDTAPIGSEQAPSAPRLAPSLMKLALSASHSAASEAQRAPGSAHLALDERYQASRRERPAPGAPRWLAELEKATRRRADAHRGVRRPIVDALLTISGARA